MDIICGELELRGVTMSQEIFRGIDTAAIEPLTVGEIMLLLRTVASQLKNDPVMEHLSPALTHVVAQLAQLQQLAKEVADEDALWRTKTNYLN